MRVSSILCLPRLRLEIELVRQNFASPQLPTLSCVLLHYQLPHFLRIQAFLVHLMLLYY